MLAQFKRCAIVMSNLIVFKLDYRMTVDLNVKFNLVVSDSTDSNIECMHVWQGHWDNGKICVIIMYVLSLAQV